MNIHEYQAKKLLSEHGVPVPPGEVCTTPEEARAVAGKLFGLGYRRVIIKSQIHAGGRGKGVFKNGKKGGVKVCKNLAEVYINAKNMLGNVLVTKQTGPEGKLVRKVLVEAGLDVQFELYLGVVLDRAIGRPVMITCKEGGMDIEEVAARNPESIIREVIDPAIGLMPYQARRILIALGLKSELLPLGVKLLHGVYRTWWECEASLVEINPLHVFQQANGEQSLIAVDGKVVLDDNALFRHPELLELRDYDEESPLEVEASNYNLNYIKLNGNIACLVNGAGLAMATMDIIKYYGGEPANFLDVGGGASPEQVSAAFKIIATDPNVKAILVNIFGGIMQCDIIANGIIAAVNEHQLKIPIVVRLEGNKSDIGKKMLAESGLNLINATTMSDAGEKVVKAAKQAHLTATITA
ncbi:MAG: ADP-forming succinate--CoA ligase subunit beta [Verrucomicrobiia bacterium]